MPSVGSYWYARGGQPNVVRVLEDDSVEACSYVWLNNLSPYQRHVIITMETRAFMRRFQNHPDIDDEFLGPGSLWYNRENIRDSVAVTSTGIGWDGRIETLVVRQENGAERIHSTSQFILQYVRMTVDEFPSWAIGPERYWVMGQGIRAPFRTEIEACCFLYDTMATLGCRRDQLRMYRRPVEYRPSGAARADARVVLPDEDDSGLDALLREIAPILAHAPVLAFDPEQLEQRAKSLPLGAARQPASLWDHLIDDEER